MLTTPAEISDSILQFCQELASDSTPFWVAVHPELNGQIDNCFDVVDSVVADRGGNRQDGWLIWEWSGVLLEAIFHAVHFQSEGSLVDLTPKEDGESRILFLPDPTRFYDGEMIGSKFFPLMDHPSVHDYIQTAQAMTDVRRSVSRDGLGEMPSDSWHSLQRRMGELRAAIGVESRRCNALAELTNQIIGTDDDLVRVEMRACQMMVAQGQHQAAMDRGIQLIIQDKQRFGEPVRQFILNVLHALADQPELVREYRRNLGIALN